MKVVRTLLSDRRDLDFRLLNRGVGYPGWKTMWLTPRDSLENSLIESGHALNFSKRILHK